MFIQNKYLSFQTADIFTHIFLNIEKGFMEKNSFKLLPIGLTYPNQIFSKYKPVVPVVREVFLNELR